MKAADYRLTAGSLRELSTVGIVCGLAAGYASILLTVSDFLGTMSDYEGGGIGIILGTVSSLFILIALFVAALVIANGVDTVIAGRTEQLTLLRLIGASSSQLRASLTRGVAQVAAIGAGVGVVVGVGAADAARVILVSRGLLPDIRYSYLPPTTLVAALIVVAVAVAATVIGSRRTLSGVAANRPRASRRWLANTTAVLSIGVGALALAGGAFIGEYGSSFGVFPAFFGTVAVTVGLLLSAQSVVPRVVAGVGRLLGRSPAAMLARKNAVADKARTTRSMIGLFVGVTLVVTVVAGMSSLQESVSRWGLSEEDLGDARQGLSMMMWILVGLLVISVIIAAVGFVSTMSLTVISRTREIGMLRAMGFTAAQVRQTITMESIALSGTATVAGLAFGTLFGAVGTQSLIGAMTPGFPIGLPLGALVAIVVGTAVVVTLAALPPSRRAVTVSPIDALAVA